MKHEEAIKKALRSFRDEEEDALLRLALLKERADYRGWFTVALRKTVEAAYARIGEENAKGPGYIPDEETINALAAFKGELRHRFGIRGLTIPPSLTPTAWLDVLDPAVNVEEIPAKIRRAILPRLFYTPGVWEVVPKSVHLPCSNKHPAEGWETTSPECAPYERFWKIDLRKKRSQLLREFKARLDSVDAQRGMNPEAYEAWDQDRSRKREQAWQHLEVWKLRRERKGFIEIAKALRLKTRTGKLATSTAKMRFYRAYELIEGHTYDQEKYKLTHWNLRECATCPEHPDRGGKCKELCPDILELVGKCVTPMKSHSKIDEIEMKHLSAEWFKRETRELQTKEDE